ncbi:MAG: hypothetical protein FD181_20 [Prolixibacteraceae bacterium]|nr:MAG: hypothetical protein FD181_20 [Prolixibacteraceae bacterium]
MKMIPYLVILTLFVTILSCSQGNQNEVVFLSNKEIKQGWELLFDGKSFEKWKAFNGGEVTGWKIVGNEMHNSGTGSDHGGDIITKKQYENFELYLEWKVAPQSNSGVFIHVQEGLTDAIYESGPEYQLIDDKGWPGKLEDWQRSGANYAMHPPKNARVKPIDEWNTTHIVVKNPRVEHLLNGKEVVEYDLWGDEWKALKASGKWAGAPHYGEAKSGHIGLQDHGGLTMIRNIKIREIKE